MTIKKSRKANKLVIGVVISVIFVVIAYFVYREIFYSVYIKNNFIESCSIAKNSKVEVCNCMWDKIHSKYNLNDYRILESTIAVTGKTPEGLSEITNSCLSEFVAAQSPTPTKTLEEKNKWKESKAGKICSEHTDWKEGECEKIANNSPWIGMSYDMTVTMMGRNPDSVNKSNYGEGNNYQWCWTGGGIMCFYDKDQDGLVDSYN